MGDGKNVFGPSSANGYSYLLHEGDVRDWFEVWPPAPPVSWGDERAQLIFTDPPYAREYLSLYGWMADTLPLVMDDGASLITLVGHSLIPDVMQALGHPLRFRWMCCLWQPGSKAKMSMGVEVCWKPMLWYVNGKFPNERQRKRGFVSDAVISPPSGVSARRKRYRWEQCLEWAMYYVERLTDPGDIVFDPFMGVATVGEACIRLGRRFIGAEIDPDVFHMAETRLMDVAIEHKEQR